MAIESGWGDKVFRFEKTQFSSSSFRDLEEFFKTRTAPLSSCITDAPRPCQIRKPPHCECTFGVMTGLCPTLSSFRLPRRTIARLGPPPIRSARTSKFQAYEILVSSPFPFFFVHFDENCQGFLFPRPRALSPSPPSFHSSINLCLLFFTSLALYTCDTPAPLDAPSTPFFAKPKVFPLPFPCSFGLVPFSIPSAAFCEGSLPKPTALSIHPIPPPLPGLLGRDQRVSRSLLLLEPFFFTKPHSILSLPRLEVFESDDPRISRCLSPLFATERTALQEHSSLMQLREQSPLSLQRREERNSSPLFLIAYYKGV